MEIGVHNLHDVALIDGLTGPIHVYIRWIVISGRWRLLLRSLYKDVFRSETLSCRRMWALHLYQSTNKVRSRLSLRPETVDFRSTEMNVASVQAPANETLTLCSCEPLVLRRSARVIVNKLTKRVRHRPSPSVHCAGFSAAYPPIQHHYSSIHTTGKHTEFSQTVTAQ